jgi:hypothetical protein
MCKTMIAKVNLNKYYCLLLEISSTRSEAFIMQAFFTWKYHHSKYLAQSFNDNANLFEIMQNLHFIKKTKKSINIIMYRFETDSSMLHTSATHNVNCMVSTNRLNFIKYYAQRSCIHNC